MDCVGKVPVRRFVAGIAASLAVATVAGAQEPLIDAGGMANLMHQQSGAAATSTTMPTPAIPLPRPSTRRCAEMQQRMARHRHGLLPEYQRRQRAGG